MRFPVVDTRDCAAVEAEVQTSYQTLFPAADPYFVSRVFFWATNCFTGNYRDYQAIDARYHDFEHTLQGTLCMVRLLHGRQDAGAEPRLTERMFKLGLLAILLHDTGYLKKRGDLEGTGAKFTMIHVSRSADFAAVLLGEKGYGSKDIKAVQNMIRCTGVNVDLQSIPFQDELERIVGFALGTADLLGQMAADDYIDKLPILYQEFSEAYSYDPASVNPRTKFSSAEDLLRKTPLFWEHYVLPKIAKDFQNLYLYLSDPYPDGPNFYVDRILANLERLKGQLTAVPAV